MKLEARISLEKLKHSKPQQPYLATHRHENNIRKHHKQ